jgi:hypothetical protein
VHLDDALAAGGRMQAVDVLSREQEAIAQARLELDAPLSAEIPAPVSTRTRLPLSSWIRIRALVSCKHEVVKADQC